MWRCFFYYCNAYCTKKVFQSKSSPGGHFRLFFGLSCGIFLNFLRTVWFLMKICKYTLMAVRLKNFMGELPFAWCYFQFCCCCCCCFFEEGGEHIFSIFSLFLEKGLVCFMELCKDILGITLAIAQKIIWHVAFILQDYFELCWSQFELGHTFWILGHSFYVKWYFLLHN